MSAKIYYKEKKDKNSHDKLKCMPEKQQLTSTSRNKRNEDIAGEENKERAIGISY